MSKKWKNAAEKSADLQVFSNNVRLILLILT